MLWWLVVIASATLIASGTLILARDIRRTWRSRQTGQPSTQTTFRTQPATAEATRRTPVQATSPPTWTGQSSGEPTPTIATGDLPPTEDDEGITEPARPRAPAVETQWRTIKPEVETAMAAVSRQLSQIGIAFAAPGTPAWSLKNRGFGDYRRVLVDNDSIAWLRLELRADGSITVKVRAHDSYAATIKGGATAPARRAEGQLALAILECLANTIQYANWRHTNVARTASRREATVRPAAPLPSTRPSLPSVALTDSAIDLVNGAFKQAGARLMPLMATQWAGVAGRNARVLAIDAQGALAGTMLVDPLPERIDIAVSSGRGATANAASRQSLPVAGLTVQTLAEAIATAAWPAVADALPQQAK